MKHDPTFWILARASGLTAYVLLTLSVLAGLVLKSRPFRALKPAAVTDTHRILALLGLGASPHGTALVLDRRCASPALFVPGSSPTGPSGRARGPRGRAHGARLRLVLAAQADRPEELAPAALGDVRDLRRGDRARPRAGTDTARPWAFALYLGAVGSVAATTLAGPRAAATRRAPPGDPAQRHATTKESTT